MTAASTMTTTGYSSGRELLFGGARWGIYRSRLHAHHLSESVLMTIGGLPDGVAHWFDMVPVQLTGPRDHNYWQRVAESEPPGAPLSSIMPPIAPHTALALGLQVGHIVRDLHQRGLILGGLQPELIYFRPSRRGPELTGLVPLATLLSVARVRTSAYSCPFPNSYSPSAGALPPEPHDDVFALCALIAHWLSGYHPFRGLGPGAQRLAISSDLRRPLPATVPPTLLAALESGLHKDPKARLSMPMLLTTLQQHSGR